jgi:hypothetical protein
MSRYFSILSLVIILYACYHDAPEPSFDMGLVIPQDSMVILMTDLQLVDGAVNLKSRSGKSLSDYANAYTDQVLEKHGVSREEFTESIRYYSFHIEKMDKIYEEVIIRLGKTESEATQVD